MFDLTKNKEYSKKANHNMKKNLPWRYVEDYYFNYSDDIVAGTKEIRKGIKYSKELEQGNVCECCGIVLCKQPWNRTWALCHKCNQELEKSVGIQKYPPYEEKVSVFDVTPIQDRIIIETNKNNAKICL